TQVWVATSGQCATRPCRCSASARARRASRSVIETLLELVVGFQRMRPHRGVARLCCMEAAKRALAPARDQLCDTDADGLPEIAHTIERFDRNCDFGHAAGIVAGFQDISD